MLTDGALGSIDMFLLKCFFVGGILLFFSFVWWAWTDHFARISEEENRQIEREALGCEDADEQWPA